LWTTGCSRASPLVQRESKYYGFLTPTATSTPSDEKLGVTVE
jgi:hypothetical protein